MDMELSRASRLPSKIRSLFFLAFVGANRIKIPQCRYNPRARVQSNATGRDENIPCGIPRARVTTRVSGSFRRQDSGTELLFLLPSHCWCCGV